MCGTLEQGRSNNEIFSSLPVPRAVAVMVIPAIVSQIIHVIYNLADTWFVGLTGDPDAVAAISLCLPLYNILTGLSNLFGVGGASVIARAIGYGAEDKARWAFSMSVWIAGLVSLVYALILIPMARPLLLLVGGDGNDIGYAVRYTVVTIVIGGVPTVLAATISNLIRATGQSRKAAVGMTIGAVLNIALDPLFMFVLLPPGNEVLGAAIATAVSNVLSLIYFVVFILRDRDDILSLRPERGQGMGLLLADITKCGLPGFTMVALSMLSNCFLNATISGFGGGAAVAGLGIVRKIDSLAYAVNQGITQGMLPLVAFCYASGLRERMRSVIGFSTACTVIFSVLCSAISFLFAPELVAAFLKDEATIRFGAAFLRVLCLAIPVYSVTFVIIAVFQAAGRSLEPFALSILHKGSFDILLLFFIRSVFGPEHVLWATPVTECMALIAALILLFRLLRQRKTTQIGEVLQ